ncbi:hypothetical protein ACF0H5_015341 [Mactra antiquata]
MPRVVQNPVGSILPSVKCHIHPENVYELYCERHDDVLCVACKLVNHSKCGVLNVQDNVKNQNEKSSILKQKCLQKMERLWSHLDKVKDGKQCELEREEGSLAVALADIEQFKNREIERIEGLAARSRAEAERRDQMVREQINKDIKAVEDRQREIDCFQIQVCDSTAENDCDMFVYEKLTSRMASSMEDLIGTLSIDDTDFVSVDMPRSVSIPNPTVSRFPYRLDLAYSGDVVQSKPGCDLRDLCILDNGQMIFADFDNKCLHRSDCLYKLPGQSFKFLESCAVAGEPWGICSLGFDKVAVTLCVQMKVCLVYVGSAMQVTSDFAVGEQCRGICFSNDLLYVSCWAKKDKPMPGEIREFDLKGNLCRSFKVDPYTGSHMFSFLTHLSVSTDGKFLYVSDCTDGKSIGNGLMIIDTGTGMRQHIADAKELSQTFGIGTSQFGEMIVGSREKKVVYCVNSAGQILQELHHKVFDSNPPQSLKYFKKHLVLTTRKSPKVFVFKVSTQSN